MTDKELERRIADVLRRRLEDFTPDDEAWDSVRSLDSPTAATRPVRLARMVVAGLVAAAVVLTAVLIVSRPTGGQSPAGSSAATTSDVAVAKRSFPTTALSCSTSGLRDPVALGGNAGEGICVGLGTVGTTPAISVSHNGHLGTSFLLRCRTGTEALTYGVSAEPDPGILFGATYAPAAEVLITLSDGSVISASTVSFTADPGEHYFAANLGPDGRAAILDLLDSMGKRLAQDAPTSSRSLEANCPIYSGRR
jgi:hypothetical protein